jgi:hypothetical protein
MYFSMPTSSFGYYRGSPVAGGEGSGMGPNMSGSNVFSAGQGSVDTAGSGAWTPTILYLFVLIFVEMFVFAFIARHV